MQNQKINYGLPITVGITGHRDIKNPDKIIEILRGQMEAIQRQFPNTPLYALSALAEGADRFFANLALVMQGWSLHVILPMKPEIYRKDFDRPESRDEFERLCTAAQSCTVIHPVVPGSEEQIEQQGLHRDLQYAKAGIFMARRSHILMAIWDGKQPRGLGGTAQIIQFRETGNLDINLGEQGVDGLTPAVKDLLLPVNPLYAPEKGLVCKIFCERGLVSQNHDEAQIITEGVEADQDAHEVGGTAIRKIEDSHQRSAERSEADTRATSMNRLYEVEWTEGTHSKPNLSDLLKPSRYNKSEYVGNIGPELSRMDELNKKINEYAEINPGILNSIPDYSHVDVRFRTPALATRCLLDKMITAKTQAVRSRLKFVFVAIAIYLMASSRAPGDSENWVTISIFLSFIILLSISIFIKKNALIKQNSEITYQRSVAEGLRIQDYWNISGVQKAVFLNYARQESELLHRIRVTLQGCCMNISTQEGFDETVSHIKDRWIDDQIRYYQKSIKLKSKISSRFSKASIVLFLSGLGLLSLVAAKNLLALFGVMDGQYILPFHLLEHFSEILIGYSALSVTYREFSGASEDIEDYSRICGIFMVARDAMDKCGLNIDVEGIKRDFSIYNVRSIIYSLGVDVLNGDTARWFKRSSRKKIELNK